MKALIFGAGKIARGFVAQLLSRSGYEISFAEANAEYAKRLDAAGRYYIHVMGNPKESEWIANYRCFSYEEMRAIAQALFDADIVFTSVVGKNLENLGSLIARLITMHGIGPMDRQKTIITCENWKNPAEVLKQAIERGLEGEEERSAFRAVFGLTDAVVMRSAVEPTQDVLAIDPLAVSVHNFWRLPVDARRFKGPHQNVTGLEYKEDFNSFLQQKVFTYNGGNATIAYLGTLKGHKYLADAANDPEIVEILQQVYREINAAVSRGLKIPMEEQISFARSAIQKYQDRNIIDFTERHARDPLRKLGPADRIVGVARMIETNGIEPEHIAYTLAAALYYRSENRDDPSAAELERMRRDYGIAHVLRTVCKVEPEEKLAKYVVQKIDELKKRGWIHEN